MQSLWPIGGANRAIFGEVIELAEDEGRESGKKIKGSGNRGLTGQKDDWQKNEGPKRVNRASGEIERGILTANTENTRKAMKPGSQSGSLFCVFCLLRGSNLMASGANIVIAFWWKTEL